MVYAEYINLISTKWPSGLSYWFISSGTLALIVFAYYKWKERKRFRVCCRILFVEVNHHRCWIEKLSNGDRDILDFLIHSDLIDYDWKNLKYEPVFARMSFKQFEAIIDHYNGMRVMREIAKRIVERNLSAFPKDILDEKWARCSKAYDVLSKFAHPTIEKNQCQQRNP